MHTVAQDILAKATLPTHLSSAEIQQQIAADIRRRAIFSARTTQAGYLQRLQKVLAQIASGRIDDATARATLLRHLDQAGYTPATGFPGDAARGVPPGSGLTDLSSQRRLNLILRTNRLATASVAMLQADTPETTSLFPALKLERYMGRREPRQDWWQRWHSAGESVAWQGASTTAMIALKSSPIWQALGDGVGGYTDTLGNPYPPFAFGSGLAWTPVSAAEAESLGLTLEGEAALSRPSLTPGEKEIQDALHRLGPDFTQGLIAELEGVA